MTIRRRQHAFADPDEEGFHLRRLSRDADSRSIAPTHTALTDFGPETLIAFVRRQLEGCRSEGISSTSQSHDVKGKRRADYDPTIMPQPTRPQPTLAERTHTPLGRQQLDELHARHLQAQESVRSTALTLAENALRHLRDLPDAPPTAPESPPTTEAIGLSIGKSRYNLRKRNTLVKTDRINEDDEVELEDDEDDPFLANRPRPSRPRSSERRQSRSSIRTRSRGRGTSSIGQARLNPSSNRHTPGPATIYIPGPSIINQNQTSHSRRSSNSSPGSSMPGLVDQLGDDTIRPSTNPTAVTEYNYSSLVPTELPIVVFSSGSSGSTGGSQGTKRRTPIPLRHLRTAAARINGHRTVPRRGLSVRDISSPPSDGDFDTSDDEDDEDDRDMLSPKHPFISNDPSRDFQGTGPRVPPEAHSQCSLPEYLDCQNEPLPSDVWIAVCEYLSFQDIKNLRLVNQSMVDMISPVLFRSIVVRLDKDMLSLGAHPKDSVLAKHGDSVHRFGIAFEYDPSALTFAPAKNSMQTQQAWFGQFDWPASQYPRYEEIKQLEDLVDNNNPLLNNVFSQLGSVWELGLSIDSGHGWLEGPDISDMALFDIRQKKGSKVLGSMHENEHVWQAYSRDEYFKWAQQNAINETLSAIASGTDEDEAVVEITSRMAVRERASFTDVTSQPDYDPYSHTGGLAPADAAGRANVQPPALPPAPFLTVGHPQQLAQTFAQATNWQTQGGPGSGLRSRPRSRSSRANPEMFKKQKKRRAQKMPLQWPIIFNGYNLAAETGGLQTAVRSRVADPRAFSMFPGSLTEAQAQWLMETFWAQKSFMIAYTNAVITNERRLGNVRVLNIAKISSGLLPSLAQPKFWAALPQLRRLKLLVAPDWRVEHHPHSAFIQKSLRTSPLNAVGKLAALLRDFVCALENLSHATLGWVGGGEHAVGILARNQHLLPAPIITEAHEWITDHDPKQRPDPRNMIKFDHIRDLTFENCWFSPCMLTTFMDKSKDTSLHTITFDSVSMLARHHTGTGEVPMTTIGNNLRCKHSEEDWLHEQIPPSATWVQTLDRITPGSTMLDRKYDVDLIDRDETPQPIRAFRGHVQKIVLKSCGYARIENVKTSQFNQAELVTQPGWPADASLQQREAVLRGFATVDPALGSQHRSTITARYGTPGKEQREDSDRQIVGPLMLRKCYDPAREDWQGLGTLTQCVHPVEKRILEQAYGMEFGWGNTLERWAAVEDGKLEGGTGRFSGVISASDDRDG